MGRLLLTTVCVVSAYLSYFVDTTKAEDANTKKTLKCRQCESFVNCQKGVCAHAEMCMKQRFLSSKGSYMFKKDCADAIKQPGCYQDDDTTRTCYCNDGDFCNDSVKIKFSIVTVLIAAVVCFCS